MALSNWDTLAINAKGENCYGEFKSPLGITVEFYKNWLYVYDKKAWEKGGYFVEDCVMQVTEGSIRYKDVAILAKRGPKDGIYAVIWTMHYEPEYFDFMLGIGCSGYKDKIKEILTKLNRLQEYDQYDWGDSFCSDGKHSLTNLQTREEIVYHDEKTEGPYNYDADWIGIEKEDIDYLKKEILTPWLKDNYKFDEKVNKDILDKAERFNQGDLYILAATRQDIGQAMTPIGQSQPPILMQAFKKEVPDEPSGEADPIQRS